MIQNHMLQLLALTAMEPPVLFDAQQVRDEKQKVFQAIREIKPEEVQWSSVRGQYGGGTVGGKAVSAYRSEPGVSPESRTETYVALKLFIDSWRWADVPFYIRSGKRLPKRVTEIAIQFKKTPHHLFTLLPSDSLEQHCHTRATGRRYLAQIQFEDSRFFDANASRDNGLPVRFILRWTSGGRVHTIDS